MINTYKNYIIAASIGLATGFLALRLMIHLNLLFSFRTTILLVVIPIFWIMGIKIGYVISNWIKIAPQISRYFIVGVFSTAIDFSVLNLVSHLTGVTSGLVIGWINAPGFLIAVLNGYLLNKYWVFGKFTKPHKKEVAKFIFIAVLGLALSSSILILFTSYWQPLFGLSSRQWLNTAKVISTVILPLVSFAGYKFIVFRK